MWLLVHATLVDYTNLNGAACRAGISITHKSHQQVVDGHISCVHGCVLKHHDFQEDRHHHHQNKINADF